MSTARACRPPDGRASNVARQRPAVDKQTFAVRLSTRDGSAIWVAGTSTDSLRWAGQRGYHIMTAGHPHPPEKVKPGVDAWRAGLVDSGRAPEHYHCQFHVRTFVDENPERARELGSAAVGRYEEISRIGRKEPLPPDHVYDWAGMLASGRNLYGDPDECIEIIHNARKYYYFDILTSTFNFGGLPHEEVRRSMRLFAREVMPAFEA